MTIPPATELATPGWYADPPGSATLLFAELPGYLYY